MLQTGRVLFESDIFEPGSSRRERRMTTAGAYGENLGTLLRLNYTPALISRTFNKTKVAVTRCRLDVPSHGPTSPIPCEDAYMLVLQIGQRVHRDLWLDGRKVTTEPLDPGEVTLHDLRRRPMFHMYDPIDSLNFYVPQSSINACAEDPGARRIAELSFTPGIGVKDRVVAGIGSALLPAFERPEEVSQLFIDNVTLALVAHVADAFGGIKAAGRVSRGGLAPWQERLVKELLDANLAGDISVSLLAKACELSNRHFSRAFRQSLGVAPHQWLLQRRIDKAKGLLRATDVALAEVATACGFADQSHFTRAFSRAIGTTPRLWRRACQG